MIIDVLCEDKRLRRRDSYTFYKKRRQQRESNPGPLTYDLTYLSWYLKGFSIHYIYNWQLSQQAGYTMFRWFLVGRDNTEV